MLSEGHDGGGGEVSLVVTVDVTERRARAATAPERLRGA